MIFRCHFKRKYSYIEERNQPKIKLKLLLLVYTSRKYGISIIIFQGVALADSMRHTIETVMNLHLSTGKPMTTAEVLALFRMMALCKAVNETFHRHSVDVSKSSLHIIQHIQIQVLQILQGVKVCMVLFFQ